MTVPEQFKNPEDINKPIIVKFSGASGGTGYLFCQDGADFQKQKHKLDGKGILTLQEYIIGVPFYIHYFYSPLTEELEIMSMDKRYESNVDALGRIPLTSQQGLGGIEPSYTVVGNIGLVLRESLMSTALEMGEQLVAASKKLIGEKGLFGPFCIETVITPNQEIKVIEISGRIVAGTNLFIDGSPYSYLKYTEPMSTGRRIAREIKNAVEAGKLDQVID
jgi:5-formaminoimidazole-4-carboxamide-1-(beta)-D-ribofuranosyl 5'-monophosphate synthetase